MTKIAVLGSINMDLVAMVDRAPAPGQTVTGKSFFTVPGGKGSNQAIAASKAGGTVTMLGAVGTDAYAETALQALSDAGVDTHFVHHVTGPTGIAHIVVDGTGTNSIIVIAGANALVSGLTEDHREAIRNSDALLMQLELELPVVMEAAAFAKHHGVKVVLTPAPVQPLADELLSNVDLLVLNEGEALALAQTATIELAAQVLLEKTAAVLVTLGDRGCIYFDAGTTIGAPAHRVNVVDTTAAGDTFAGALVVSLAEGKSMEVSLVWAAAAAALAVQKPGASPSMPGRAAIDGFIRERTSDDEFDRGDEGDDGTRPQPAVQRVSDAPASP